VRFQGYQHVEGVVPSGTPAGARGIAVKLWAAARSEFSLRGYHGARVQGIARRAGCNVALLYRHWASKKALYLELLKSVWLEKSRVIADLAGKGIGAPAIVGAYLDALLSDPEGAQILVREYLDGGPHLSQLAASDATLLDSLRSAAQVFASGNGEGLRPGLDPELAALTIGGLAAFVASAPETARVLLDRPVPTDVWREHVSELFLRGLIGRQEPEARRLGAAPTTP
jgi:AcrR family transcriptional regulator